MTSVRTDVLARYAKFLQGLRNSPSREVAVMFGVVRGDVQTTTRYNVNLIRLETAMDPTSVTPSSVKKTLIKQLPAVPVRDRWRMGYLGSMLQSRGEAFYAGKGIRASDQSD